MSLDMDDLRQRAAEELTGIEADIARYRNAFREYDPEGAELLEDMTEYLEQNFVVPEQLLRDPIGVALQTGLGAVPPEIEAQGKDLFHRLVAFHEETGRENPADGGEFYFTELNPKNNE